ncbi:glycosyltransferase family 39 protein [Methanomethylovorans sp.]|uniref:glycosyltransferase family 39 protein n=2 Tax=Methanomethylovorans sp. TaxID=2758717 RepID=UPI003D140DF7
MGFTEKLGPRLLNRHEIPLLFSFFFLLVALKAILIFPFTTPWIFADELVYSKLAHDILDLVFISDITDAQTYPPGYSIFLSVADLFSSDKQALYRNMLFVNSFLSSSTIFPAYFILKKYTSKFQALGGSLIISTLPSVVTYTFVLMSENLFVPLTLYSIWFLHECFEHDKMRWHFLAGISIFYLYLTRETGIVFIVSVFLAIFYFFWITGSNVTSKTLKNWLVLVFSFTLPTVGWSLYKKTGFSTGSLYNTSTSSSSLLDSFTKVDSFELFVRLVLNEIGYILLSTYIIIFIVCFLLISESTFKLKFAGPSGGLAIGDPKNTIALNSTIVYFISFSAGLILITVAHMKRYIGNPENFIFGRYIDPIVPVVFLFGLIGIAFLQTRYDDIGIKRKYKQIMFLTILVVPLLYYLPHTYYGFPNMFGIFYVIYLQKYMSYMILLFLFAALFVIIPLYLLKDTHNSRSMNLFFVYLIFLSVLLCIPTYEMQLEHVRNMNSVNQIGRYLEDHSSDDTLILIDQEDVSKYLGYQMWFRTRYWVNGEFVQGHIYDGPSELSTKKIMNDADYIISKKLLPYECVQATDDDYKLYDLKASSQLDSNVALPYTIDIGKDDKHFIEGFYGPELGKIRWTTNSSKIKIEYGQDQGPLVLHIMMEALRPEKDPANVTFYMNGNKIGSLEKIIGARYYSVVVPQNHLEARYQILEIRTNTWKPIDYGIADNRVLGVKIDWIKIDYNSNITLPYTIDIGKDDQHLVEGFYGPELGKIRWTTNSSKIKIEYVQDQGPLVLHMMMEAPRPDTDPANVTLYMNGNLIGSAEKIIGNRDYSVVVPENYLEDRYQILEIRTNTWKPSDHGYVNDDRDLGIQIDWIKIDSLSNGATDYITATYG